MFNKNNEEQIDTEIANKDLKGNSRIKKMLGLGSIGLTLIAAAAIIGPNPSISNLLTKVEADSSHKVCVSGYYESDPSINAKKGDCEGSTFVPPVHTGEDSEPSGDFEKGIITTSDGIKLVCGPHSYTISKENYDKGVENYNKIMTGGVNAGISEVVDGWAQIHYADYGASGESVSLLSSSHRRGNTAGPRTFIFDNNSGTCTVDYSSTIVKITDKGLNTAGLVYETLNSEGVQIRGSYVNAEGKPHREGAPAEIRRTLDGKDVTFEEWYINGVAHRIGAPAHINSNEYVYTERWKVNGVFHRTDGPADIDTSKSKNPALFYINGSRITDRETWISSGGTPEGWDNNQK